MEAITGEQLTWEGTESSALSEGQEWEGQALHFRYETDTPETWCLCAAFSALLQSLWWLFYREKNLVFIGWRLTMEIQALQAFIFHHVISGDFACLKFCLKSKCLFSINYLAESWSSCEEEGIKKNLKHIFHEANVKFVFFWLHNFH